MERMIGQAKPRILGGRVISLEYQVRLRDGQVVEATSQHPIDYLHGGGQILPALERALEGLCEGDRAAFTIPAEDAYGARDASNIALLPRSLFPAEVELTAGMRLLARASGGQTHLVTVREVRSDEAVVDLNHPLAGERLFFEVRVIAVRPAGEDEVFSGRPHPAERV